MLAPWVQILVPFLALIAMTAASTRVRRNPNADKNQCPQGPNAGIHLYADPDDCTKYFTCSNGFNFPMSCPAGLRFSNTYLTCAEPNTFFDTCQEQQASSTPAPRAATNRCPQGVNPGPFLYVDAEDCSRFYMCANGLNVPMSCPAGLHFSDELQTCVRRGSENDICEVERAVRRCRAGQQWVIPHRHLCHL